MTAAIVALCLTFWMPNVDWLRYTGQLDSVEFVTPEAAASRERIV